MHEKQGACEMLADLVLGEQFQAWQQLAGLM